MSHEETRTTGPENNAHPPRHQQPPFSCIKKTRPGNKAQRSRSMRRIDLGTCTRPIPARNEKVSAPGGRTRRKNGRHENRYAGSNSSHGPPRPLDRTPPFHDGSRNEEFQREPENRKELWPVGGGLSCWPVGQNKRNARRRVGVRGRSAIGGRGQGSVTPGAGCAEIWHESEWDPGPNSGSVLRGVAHKPAQTLHNSLYASVMNSAQKPLPLAPHTPSAERKPPETSRILRGTSFPHVSQLPAYHPPSTSTPSQ